MTLTAELNQKAKSILFRELGPVDYARFFQQYEEGIGNYTDDRHQWLGDESAGSIHGQTSKLAASGDIPRPSNARLLNPEG